MSVSGNVVTVLTRDGEFCEVPCTQNVLLGSEIEWETEAIRAPARRMRGRSAWSWRSVAVSAAAAVVAITGGIYYYGTQTAMAATPYAYVSVEINPDVSLVLNKRMHVISASGLNDGGKTLIRNLSLKGESVREAIGKLLDSSVADHMLTSSDNIVVTSAPAQISTDVTHVQTEVQRDVQDAVGKNISAQKLKPKVYSIRVSKTVWKAASSAKIPPGKLATYLIAKKHHLSLTPNELQSQTTRMVLDESKGDNEATTDDAKQVQSALRDIPIRLIPTLTVAQAFHPGITAQTTGPENGRLVRNVKHPGKPSRGDENVTRFPSKDHSSAHLPALSSLVPAAGTHPGETQLKPAAGQHKKQDKQGAKKENVEHPKEKNGKPLTSTGDVNSSSLVPDVTSKLPGNVVSHGLVQEAPGLMSSTQSPTSKQPHKHGKKDKQSERNAVDAGFGNLVNNTVNAVDSSTTQVKSGNRFHDNAHQQSHNKRNGHDFNGQRGASDGQSDQTDTNHGRRHHDAHPIILW